MSAQSALDALLDQDNRRVSEVALPEGITLPSIFERLSAGTEIPVADFEAAAADLASFGLPADAVSLEGYLFPATYKFEPGTDGARHPPAAREPHLPVARRGRRPGRAAQPGAHDRLDDPARGADHRRLLQGLPRHPEPARRRACSWSSTPPRTTARTRQTRLRVHHRRGARGGQRLQHLRDPRSADRTDLRSRRRRDRCRHAPGRRDLAVLRDRQPRHRRDGVLEHGPTSTTRRSTSCANGVVAATSADAADARDRASRGARLADRALQVARAARAPRTRCSGLPWEYSAIEVVEGSLGAFLNTLDESWRGLSLTMPLKREILPLLAPGRRSSTRSARPTPCAVDADPSRRAVAARLQHRRRRHPRRAGGPRRRAVCRPPT